MKKALFFLLIASLLFGCGEAYQAKRSSKLFYKAVSKSKPTVSDNCGSMFPPTDSVHEVVQYKPGAVVVKHDTLKHVDTVVKDGVKYLTRYLQDTVTIHDTVEHTKYVQQHNEAKEEAQAATIVGQNKQIGELDGKLSIWKWIAGIEGLLIVAFLVLKFAFKIL